MTPGTSNRRKARGPLRRTLRLLLATIAAILAFTVVSIALLATPPGRAALASVAERATSGDGLTLSVGTLSGWPPFSFGVDRITVSDQQGAFASIEQLRVDLHAGALLAGRLAFRTITADRVAIVRPPSLPASESGGRAAVPPIAAERLSIAQLELGSGLVGQAATLSLTGSFSAAADGGLSARLDGARTDGRLGRLAARLDRPNVDAPLAVTLDAAEAADGILVGLIGRDSGPGYRFTAESSAHGGALSGTVSLTSDGAARFSGRFELTAPAETTRLVIDGEGDLGDLTPPNVADLISGPIRLAVDADFEERPDALPRLVVRQGTASTGTVRAEVSGAFAGAGSALTIRLDAARTDGSALKLPFGGTPASVETITVDGRIAPDDGVVRLDVMARLAGLSVDDLTVPGMGVSFAAETERTDPLWSERLPFALRVEADAIDTPSGRIAATTDAPLLLVGKGKLDARRFSAEMSTKLAVAGSELTYVGSLSAATAHGHARVHVPDLAPLTPLAGRPLKGAVATAMEGSFFGPTGLALAVSGTANALDAGDAPWAGLLTGDTQFAATFTRGADGRLAVNGLTIEGVNVSAKGDFAVNDQSIDGSLNGRIADLSALSPTSRGAATISAELAGPVRTPRIQATLAVAEGELLGRAISDALARLEGGPTDKGWQGRLALSGSFAGRPLQGRTLARLDTDDKLSLPEIDLAIGTNRITGAIERAADGLLSGALDIDAPDLTTLAALALTEAGGSAKARVRLTPEADRQSVALAFSSRDLSLETASVATSQGEISVADAFGAPLIRGNVTVGDIQIGTTRLDTANFNANVENGATQFEFSARGPDLNLAGAGRVGGFAGATLIEIARLSGDVRAIPVRLDGATSIRFGEDEIRLAGTNIAVGNGRMKVDGAVAPELELTVALDRIGASLANRFSPGLGAEGVVSGNATITGTPAAPNIAWQANWTGMRVAATRSAGVPNLSLAAKGTATRTGTTTEVELTGAGLSLNVSGVIPFGETGLDIRATGTAPLALLAAAAAREVRLAGTARLDIRATGPVSAPAASGTIALIDATLADPQTGGGVRGLNGRILLAGRQATIERMAGRLTQGGEIAVSGSVQIDPDADFPANLSIIVQNGRYADGTTANVAFDAELAISGPLLSNGTISGRITLGRTEILLPDRIGGGGRAINVEHRNAPPDFAPLQRPRQTQTGQASGDGGLRLNLTVNATGGIFVRGFGMDAELDGSVRLAGTTGAPQAVGAFDLRRGRLEVIGRRFDFTRGQLSFAGSLIPLLDFAATTRITDATANVLVTGHANAPEISFSSTPEMPEEEILSRLLFDRSVGTLSPLQAAQLVDAAAQLSGAVGRGQGLFDQVRRATGLDDLDIRQNEAGGTSVGIGRRINDNLRLGFEQDTKAGAGAGRVTIDLDITRNLKARGEAGADGSGKVGITLEREY